MATLKLTLKKKWFDLILSGEKKEEYREIKPFFVRRLTQCSCDLEYATEQLKKGGDYIEDFYKNKFREDYCFPKHYDLIEFSNGYGASVPKIIIECKIIQIDIGKVEWGAIEGEKYFVIKLGEIISTKNLK